MRSSRPATTRSCSGCSPASSACSSGGRTAPPSLRSQCHEAPLAETRPAEVDEELLGGVAAAMALVKAYRTHGHLAARLDPLGSEPPGDPSLEPERMDPKLTPELQARIPARLLRTYVEGETLAEALPRLQRDVLRDDRVRDRAHLRSRGARLAPRGDRVGPLPRSRSPTTRSARCSTRLTEVEGLETYLRKAFLGQKQFSIEGLDVLVPMLDEAIQLAAEARRARGRDRHGAPRPAQRARARDRPPVRDDPARVRGRADARGGQLGLRGRHRRREVPPRRARQARRRRTARSTSRSRRTRATSRRSTPSSRDGRAPTRPTARRARGCTIRPSRSRSSSTATPRSPRRASSPRRSTSRTSTATRPAARST